MKDIVSWETGLDLGVTYTQTEKAKNILSTQIGALEYAQDLGIDVSFFLSENFQFQNESFKAYLVQTLAMHGINVAALIDTVDSLSRQYTFELSADRPSDGLIAR